MQIKNNLVQGANPYQQNKVGQANQAGQAGQAANSSAQQAARSGADSVQVSQEARVRSTVLTTAFSAQETRAEKVQQLREDVRNGTYKPNVRKTAENLVRDDMELFTGGERAQRNSG